VYDIFARIPANLLAESNYTVTASCIMTRHDEPEEFPLVVYNALTFIAFATGDAPETAGPVAGRLQKPGLIAPKIEWTMKVEEGVDAARA